MNHQSTVTRSPEPLARPANDVATPSQISPISVGQLVRLFDRHHRFLGDIQVESIENNLILGSFKPAPDYQSVEPIFEEHVACVNDMVLSVAAQLEEKIAALGLYVTAIDGTPLRAIDDVQIGSCHFSCRIR